MSSKNAKKTILKNRKAIVVLAVAIIVLAGVAYPLSTTGSYTTAYEGAKARFIGVKDQTTGLTYTNTQKRGASVASFDSTMNFDIDAETWGKPNIAGEMTSIFIPKSDASATRDWVPTGWWSDAMKWQNPQNVYEWNIQNDDGSTTVYRMEEWATKWFVSLSAEWDLQGNEFWSALGLQAHIGGVPEQRNQRYNNLEVWFEFDISPTWYFSGTDRTYFAIAKVQLNQIEFSAFDHFGKEEDQSSVVRITPMSTSSALTIYTSQFGSSQSTTQDAFMGYYHQQSRLNPAFFRDKVYSKITLNDFGTTEWWQTPLTDLRAKGDVVTLGFTVTQFVVGEWKVQDIQDMPDDYGRTSKVGYWGWSGISDFFGWLTSPAGMFWLIIIILFVTFILILWRVPWIIEAVTGAFSSKRKGGGRK